MEKATPDTSDEKKRDWTLPDVIATEWKKVLFCDEFTMQQCVPHHIHIRWPLGKRVHKKYVVATMKHQPS